MEIKRKEHLDNYQHRRLGKVSRGSRLSGSSKNLLVFASSPTVAAPSLCRSGDHKSCRAISRAATAGSRAWAVGEAMHSKARCHSSRRGPMMRPSSDARPPGEGPGTAVAGQTSWRPMQTKTIARLDQTGWMNDAAAMCDYGDGLRATRAVVAVALHRSAW